MNRGKKERPIKRLLRAYRCEDLAAAKRMLRQWYRGKLGQALLKEERQILDDVLPNLFGYHLLQIGAPVDVNLLEASRISHCMVLDDTLDEGRGTMLHCLYGDASALPIASDSVDVLVLPHTLEFEANPHQVLREADRALVPEGHVVILGFSPWSLWGFWRMAAGWRSHTPWCGRFFSSSRVKDWLALLGFDTVLARNYFFRPPFDHAGLMRQLNFLERGGRRWWPALGAAYVLVARKRVSTLTPIRPRWRAGTRLVPGRMTHAGLRREGPK